MLGPSLRMKKKNKSAPWGPGVPGIELSMEEVLQHLGKFRSY